MTKNIKIDDIRTDAGTQVRASINEDVATDYAEAFQNGATFPPVILFHDGNEYLLADGFHRVMGATKAGIKTINAEVRKGTRSDCIKFALSANAHHGLRRTNADKRYSVQMALKEFPVLSNRAIADICCVHHDLVSSIRQVAESATSTSGSPSVSTKPPERRTGVDGKTYPIPTRPPEVKPPVVMAPPVPTVPPPPPVQEEEIGRIDKTGWPIPEKLIPLWDSGTEKAQRWLSYISSARSEAKKAQEDKDPDCVEFNFSSFLSELNQAYEDAKTIKPFAVCPTCQGLVPAKCTLCKGRGLISEFRWNTCVPRETKEMREKIKARKEAA